MNKFLSGLGVAVFGVLLGGMIALAWLGALLKLHPMIGYLALLGCAAFIVRQRENLSREWKDTKIFNQEIGILTLIIFPSLFLIGFHLFGWCLNGFNC